MHAPPGMMEGSSESGSTGSSSAAAAAPVPQKSKWATEEDFDRHRATITRLYAEGTLTQLMETMEREYGFVATYALISGRPYHNARLIYRVDRRCTRRGSSAGACGSTTGQAT
jgi:hypothetical protein